MTPRVPIGEQLLGRASNVLADGLFSTLVFPLLLAIRDLNYI